MIIPDFFNLDVVVFHLPETYLAVRHKVQSGRYGMIDNEGQAPYVNPHL